MNNKKQSNNKDIFAFLAVFITVVVVGYLYLKSQYATYHRDQVREFFTKETEQENNEPDINKSSPFDAKGRYKNMPIHSYQRRIEQATKINEIALNLEARKKQQKQLLNRFSNLLSIKVQYPENLHYTQLDLDEGIAGIEGSGDQYSDIKTLTILATRMKVTTNQVVDFLNETNNGVPAVKNINFSKKVLRVVDPPLGSGLSKVTLLSAKNSQTIYAALVPRQDYKGSYLFIIKATPNFLNNNEGYIDKLFNTLKAI